MSTDWKSEYDVRQFKQIAEQVSAFANGAIDLGSLVASVDSLLRCLQRPRTEVADAVRSEWWELEQYYAAECLRQESGEYRANDVVSDERMAHDIRCSIKALQQLLKSYQ